MDKMKTILIIILISFSFFSNLACNDEKTQEIKMNSIYDFVVKDIDGKEVKLSDYKGKVLLIVNVASYCGYTKQYSGLEAIYRKYKDKGFEILAFPCNQFGDQEPGTNEEIKQFCSSKFDVTFPLFDKIDVNGDGAHPLYTFLKNEKPGLLGSKDIKLNFTKFLVDKNGKIVERFGSNKTPEEIAPEIEKLLN
jgi:glutathione peroxidase